MKKHKFSMIIILIVVITILAAGCSKEKVTDRVLTDQEIESILAEVVSGEEVVKEAGLRYFNGLNSENRNLIAPADLNNIVSNRPDGIYLLDIRQQKDYEAGHIKGANNCWWFDVGKNIDMLPKEKQIVVTCYTGQSAGQVVGVLRTMGYDAISLIGGMNNGWYAKDMPVVK